MLRSLVALALLLAPSLRAADVPLSDRPLAPIPGIYKIVASASPDAVLAVFVAGYDVFAQRLTLDGTPIDPGAIYLGSGLNASNIEVLWNGSRWIILWSDPAPARVAYVAPAGVIEGPYEIPVRNVSSLILLGDRVVFAASETVATPRRILFELTPPHSLAPLFSSDLSGDPVRGSWVVGLDEGPGLIVSRHWWAPPGFQGTVSVHRPAGATALIDLNLSAPLIVTFIARREGGGLLVWNDGGLRGAIIGSDASISAPFPIGPRGPVWETIVTEARPGGWNIVFGPDSETWFARIDAAGQVVAMPLDGAPHAHLLTDLVTVGDAGLLFERDWLLRAGMRVRRLRGGLLGGPIAAGAGEAAQFLARAASGDGVDLVVWEEQAAGGIVLKATRVARDGAPLDGPGLLVADEALTKWIWSSYRSSFDVAFDGEAFFVAWVRRDDDAETVMVRRVWPNGTLSVALGLAEWEAIEGVSVAGAGSARSAVAWSGYESERWNPSGRSVFVPIDQGNIGAAVEIGSGDLGWAVPNLAASSDRYLALFNDSLPCQITCEHYERPYARLFTLDGRPLTEARRISEEITGPGVPEVLSDGSSFFVNWNDALVAIDSELTVTGEMPLASWGSISIEGSEILVDRWKTRLIYTAAGELLRLEPLPPQFDGSELRAARLAHRRFVMRVDGHPSRLVIRSLAEGMPRSADVAVVARGEVVASSHPSGGFLATFRIEHRGGAPVHAIDLWSDKAISIPEQLRESDLDLEAGESITVTVGFPRDSFGGSLWVAGDVVDSIPANNVDTIAPRTRHRSVAR